MLSVGGNVRVLAGGVELPVAKDGKLPDGPFHVTLIHLAETRIMDAALVHLKELSKLKSLSVNHFWGNKAITDAGLEHLFRI